VSAPRAALLDDYQQIALAYPGVARLRERVEVTAFTDHLADEDALAERLAPFAIVGVIRERTPITRSLIARLPNLRLVVNCGMLNRVIDYAACAERGIVVCGTESSGFGTAQVTWALILALAQQIVTVDRDIRAGRWQTGLGEEIAGKTLGILGLGRYGSKVALAAKAFDMTVLAWSSLDDLPAERAAAFGAERVALDELLQRSDVVSVHLVLADATRGLIGRRELALMKPTAYLINTARGPIVDEAALVDALENRRIAGAGLDVFDVEPLPRDHPFCRLPNTVLTPHIGNVSRDAYAVHYEQLAENVTAWLDGNPIRRIPRQR
jgi:phosphoglycerate dehydrogenase-like enzyme